MNVRFISLGAVGTAALLAFAGAGAAQADSTTAIDNGGAFCFKYGSKKAGETRTVLALDIDPVDHLTKKQRLWSITGLEKGTNPDVVTENYVNNLVGSATVGKANNGKKPRGKFLHVLLTGMSYGTFDDVKEEGLWQLQYTLQLNPKTLKGKIVGLSIYTGIDGNWALLPSTTLTTNTSIRPISCKKV